MAISENDPISASDPTAWNDPIHSNDSISLIKLQKATGKQCKLFTSVSIEQENKRRTTHLHFLITVVSNSVRTVSFAYSGKVEKNFRLNKPYISVSMEQEKNRQRSCFHAISNYLGIRLENAAIARSGKLWKTFRKTSYQWRFRGVGKQSTNFLFLWHLPFAILQENARQMQRSRAWENYRITFRKTS